MGVVNETVQDGVGIGRIADYFVPLVERELAFLIFIFIVLCFFLFFGVFPGGGAGRGLPQWSAKVNIWGGQGGGRGGGGPGGGPPGGKRGRAEGRGERGGGCCCVGRWVGPGGGRAAFPGPGWADKPRFLWGVVPFPPARPLEQGAVKTAGIAIPVTTVQDCPGKPSRRRMTLDIAAIWGM